MKILLFNWRDIRHPLAGGAEIAMFKHALNWNKKGVDVIWFSSSFKNAAKTETIKNIKIIRRGSQYTVFIFACLNYLGGKFGKPDVIIDCFHGIPFFTPLFVDRKKIVAVIHEVAGNVWFANSFFPVALAGYALESVSFSIYNNVPFITVSKSTKNDLIKKGIAEKNISIINNGVSIVKSDRKYLKEKNPTIIFIGRISKDKGISDAIDAFKSIKKKINNAKFWIVGKEEKSGYIENQLMAKDLQNDVKYFGFVKDSKKFELLQKAWILIHPSKKEGWGLTVIEAASVATPTVGYNVEGLRDSIINNKTGILVNANCEHLADAVVKVINDKQKYNYLSRQAKIWSEEFDWKKSVQESWKILLQRLV